VEVDEALDVPMGAGGPLARSETELVCLLKVELELLPGLVGLSKATPLK
jgi:hypothetical protein